MKNKIARMNKNKCMILFILFLIVLLLSFSYAYFYNVDETQENVVTTECFKLSFVDQNDINLDKTYPLTEQEGSNLVPYTFTIKNVCNKAGDYEVNIETINTSTISTSYLRYKLDNNTSDILGQQLEKYEYINQNINESRNIETGLLLPNEERTYNLRIWIDENATVEQSSNKEYKGKVVVKTIENKEPYQTIILNTNGGELEETQITRVKTRQIGVLPTPSRIGYTFAGWFKDSEFSQSIDNNTIVTNELNNIYAKWDIILYTITYNYSGGSADNPLIYSIETSTFTLNNPTKTGYSFKGWSGDGTGTSISIPKGSTGNKTFTAGWTANKYTITYNYNGKKNYFTTGSTTKSDFTGASNDNIQIGSFPLSEFKLNDSYTFKAKMTYTNLVGSGSVGWSLQARGNKTSWSGLHFADTYVRQSGTGTYNFNSTHTFDDSEYLTNDTFLFQIRFRYYTSGTISLSGLKLYKTTETTATKTYGNTLGTLPTVSDNTYTFQGWYTTASGGTKISSSTAVPAEDTTYYAHWS